MVCVGETSIEVPFTSPMPLMESEVAPETDHESVAPDPCVIDAGVAAKEEMVGRETLVPPTTILGVIDGGAAARGDMIGSETTAPLTTIGAVATLITICTVATLILAEFRSVAV